jgi:hypothetical protein
MNLHREPSLNDPNRARVNLSLRRRIWWTAFVSSLFHYFLSLHLHLPVDALPKLPRISNRFNDFAYESLYFLHIAGQLIYTRPGSG